MRMPTHHHDQGKPLESPKPLETTANLAARDPQLGPKSGDTGYGKLLQNDKPSLTTWQSSCLL